MIIMCNMRNALFKKCENIINELVLCFNVTEITIDSNLLYLIEN